MTPARSERIVRALREHAKTVGSTRESARAYLIALGIYDDDGRLTREYGGMEEKKEYDRPGTYACFHLLEEDALRVQSYLYDNGIVSDPPGSLHVTAIYSRKPLPDLEELIPERRFGCDHEEDECVAHATGWQVFNASWGGYCLVMTLDFPTAVGTHTYIRKEYGGTHDYPTYIPHLTVCARYDNRGIPDFPVPEFPLRFREFEVRPINPDWKPE